MQEDSNLLDALEKILWSKRLGNGLAIFPVTNAREEQLGYMVQDLGEERGKNLGEELTGSRKTLREVLKEAIESLEADLGFGPRESWPPPNKR